MSKFACKLSDKLHDYFSAEQERWPVLIPFFFALGIALYFALPFEPAPWITLTIAELWLLLFYLLRHKKSHGFLLAGLVIICGFIDIQSQTAYKSRFIAPLKEKSVTYISGQIAAITQNAQQKYRLLLSNASDYDNPLIGNYRITVNRLPQDIRPGDCVEMIATLFPNRAIPVRGGYRLDRKYFYEGLSATGYADSEIFTIPCPITNNKSSFAEKLQSMRYNIGKHINSVLPAAQAGIAKALLIGEKTQITQPILDNYRDSGLAHLLSVSGLHLGAIAGLIFFCIRLLAALFPSIVLRFDSKKIAALFAIIGSGIYLLISGMAIPTQRAFIMTTVIFIGIIFDRRAISLRMVSFAALVVLIIAPQALISVSFQMSFAAVFALVAFYEVYSSKISRLAATQNPIYKIGAYFIGIVVADLVASLATAPISLYHFHRLAVYTSLGNLLAGAIVTFWLMPAILLCLITLALHLTFAVRLLGSAIQFISFITDFVSGLPGSVWICHTFSFGAFITVVCGGYWLCIWKQPWRRWGLILIVAGAATLLFSHQQPDFVFSPHGKDIALRDRDNRLIMLPLSRDRWTAQIWHENLGLEELSRTERQNLRKLLNNEETEFSAVDLECDADDCLYKSAVFFDAAGNIRLGQKNIDNRTGGYIYIDNKSTKLYPLYNLECRPWSNGCIQKTKENNDD